MDKLKELPDKLNEKLRLGQEKLRKFGHHLHIDVDSLNNLSRVHIRNHRLRSTPDWIRRSIRLSVCLVLFGLLGHAVHWSDDPKTQTDVMQSCNWAAITCIVVTAPYIGKVSEVSTYRIMGTVVGGFYGFATFEVGLHLISAYGGGILVSVTAPLLVVSTTYLAYKKGLDQLAKFMQLTYVIVGYGATATAVDLDVFIKTCMRIGGIIAGGLVSLLLAVVILPRSANIETCREIKKAIKLLIDLNHQVWKNTSAPVPRVEGTTNTYSKKSRSRISNRLAEPAPDLATSSVAFVSNLGAAPRMQGNDDDGGGGSGTRRRCRSRSGL